jgi:asparagine synthase (glutamine-hydrolysing)
MCGINGILRLTADAAPVDPEELRTTRDAMATRGPDGEGLWISSDGRVGLGHRRLAIIDLSDAGAQPMSRADGRYRIVFNGEIYNYRELRDQLLREGESFESHSDTEVLLALYAREGQRMLRRLRGMYAFAIWDSLEHRLLLARDPYGIKPLYYVHHGDTLRFASQVKALEAGGRIPDEVDSAGLVGFLLWGSVPEPRTIRRAVRALPAGHHLLVEQGRVSAPDRYHRFGEWPFPEAPTAAAAFESTVASHLVSDVPVGVFLSAGMDSSLLAALATRQLDRPPTTLTLRFDEFVGTERDEAPVAAEVAEALGTEHVERRVRREEFLDLWPRALAAMDQPSVDGFNTFVVSQAAHDAGFKVVLSGLGGDELMGSYRSFRDVATWRRWSRRLAAVPGARAVWPTVARTLARSRPKLVGLLELGGTFPGSYFLRRGLFLPGEIRPLVGNRIADEADELYDPLEHAGSHLDGREDITSDEAAWEAVHLLESCQYMRNQLLRDSDWASMAHSLELRVPLVDAWLREQTAALGFEPARSGGKAALVRELAPELPESLWNRPKSGFSIPVARWIDREVGGETRPGEASRRLALRVLESFGVELAA